jgi:hypothetical protein
VREQLTTLDNQQCFQEAANASRAFQVPEIRLDRAEREWPIGRTTVPQHIPYGVHFDRIAERRRTAVALDVADLLRPYSCGGESGTQERLLRLAIRRGQTAAAAILIHGRTPDQAKNAITVEACPVEALQDDDPAALPAHVTVGGGVKCTAPATGRDHAGPAQVNARLGRKQDIDAARQRKIALSRAQALARQVHSNERRRARRIHRHGRPLETENVGETPRRRAQGAARA